MKLRYPCVPLVSVDPYFNVWSACDYLNGDVTRHWTGHPQPIRGAAVINGAEHVFMGWDTARKLRQTGCRVTATSTVYTFALGGGELKAEFLSPLLLDDPELLSTPVSFLRLSVSGTAGETLLRVTVDDDIVLDRRTESDVTESESGKSGAVAYAKMGNAVQKPLNRSGDDVRIDWGYFYLASACGNVTVTNRTEGGKSAVTAELRLTPEQPAAVLMLAYDDVQSIQYFGDNLPGYWARNGKTILTALEEQAADYDAIRERCAAFDAELRRDAEAAGGEQYAELLELAYRQTVAAHKLVADRDGKLLFISKECFSNGCAATVDVSYPSIPLYLRYNPELVHGMMRPIFRFAASDAWQYDFAPHDAGQYPLLNGQVYGTELKWQMPVEECGNMLVMAAACLQADGDLDFVREHMPVYTQWVRYLVQYGADPGTQLCTDDFAGHLAHNCNLSLKAIMGIASYALLCRALGDGAGYTEYTGIARGMAAGFASTASNGDGTYRLAFDQPDTFSLKYNAVWDRLLGTEIFPEGMFAAECRSYVERRQNAYGVPLDNRSDYTKSDWLVWAATLADDPSIFRSMIARLWQYYNDTPNRTPMTDWYDTLCARQIGFQNRTVQGGLFIKLLAAK